MDYIFFVFVLLKTIKSLKKGIFGGVIGAIKAIIIFGAIYIGVNSFSEVINNQNLSSFLQSGQVVNSLFSQVIEKAISTFLPH